MKNKKLLFCSTIIMILMLQLIRVWEVETLIASPEKEDQCYINNSLIDNLPYTDYTERNKEYKRNKIKNINIYICNGFSSFRTMIMVTDIHNNIIYFKREFYFGQNSDAYDYADFGIYDDYVEFGYKIKVPLEPNLLERIDGKIIQILAKSLVSLEKTLENWK